MKVFLHALPLAIVMISVVVVALIIGDDNQKRHDFCDSQTQKIKRVCLRQQFALEAIIHNRPPELRIHIKHHLDQQILELCLGSAVPISTKSADLCWINRNEDGDECYIDVARQLLDLYQKRQ